MSDPAAPLYDPVSQQAKDTLFQAASYFGADDFDLIAKACDYAFIKHKGQTRQSGEPYITHPIAVATEVAKWKLDAKTVISALLHDVLEDTGTTKTELAHFFGGTVAEVVDGLSKLEKINFNNHIEHQAESFRKMVLAMVKDIRVLLVKLSDRLHNMRTLGSMRPDKRRRIARETIETYALLANRIGMNPVYRELQDLSFYNIHPHRYTVFQAALQRWQAEHQDVIEEIIRAFQLQLAACNIEAKIRVRHKNLYSLYNKMKSRHKRFNEVCNLYGLRIIVRSPDDCYRTLGALHALYKPRPGRFKDFIALPKGNGYQGLHTTLVGIKGIPIEVQIRTPAMDQTAEYGIATHWLYQNRTGEVRDTAILRTRQWLQNILALQEDSGNAIEFSEHIKVDLYQNEIYLFTPNGKILVLQRGSTPVDFAYAIHTDIGHSCVGAKVNGNLVPLRHRLHTGDTIEIITRENAQPNPAWLSFVVSARARSAIRSRLKNIGREDAIMLGEKLLQQTLTQLLPQRLLVSETVKNKYLADLQSKNIRFEDVLYDVGMGKLLPVSVALQIAELAGERFGGEVKLSPIKISGSPVSNIHISTCCNPIPGDAIKAALIPEQGLIIHSDTCENLLRIPAENQLDADWDSIGKDGKFSTKISVISQDQPGLLATLAGCIAAHNANIENVEMPPQPEGKGDFVEMRFGLSVTDAEQLNQILHDIQSIPQIMSAKRL